MLTSFSADERCGNCNAQHTVGRDEDGWPEGIDVVPCQGSDECTRHLCTACRHQCFSCGLWACADHCQEIDGQTYCLICLSPAPEANGDACCEHASADGSHCPVHGDRVEVAA